jgi:microcystin degradation protein MlrC
VGAVVNGHANIVPVEVRGEWVAEQAADVQDMGRRVVEVLGRDPRDVHYGADKLGRALVSTVRGLAYAGWDDVDVILGIVREEHKRAMEHLR